MRKNMNKRLNLNIKDQYQPGFFERKDLNKKIDRNLEDMSEKEFLNYFKYHIIGISGGKDSLLALLYMLNNYDKNKIIVYSMNLPYEPDSESYFNYLNNKLNIKILVYNAKVTKKGYKDLCISGGVPNYFNRWCTGYMEV